MKITVIGAAIAIAMVLIAFYGLQALSQTGIKDQ